MKEFYNKYLNEKIKLDKLQIISIILLIIAFSGVFGWLYEFVFYYFNDNRWWFQGGNFLPWINIYAIGSVLILLITYKFKKAPHIVFILSGVITGVLEYFAGWLIFTTKNGVRYWDYNTEILNFGNVSGYICFRSILVFCLCALFLIYIVLPLIIYIATKMNRKTFFIISVILCSIFLIDEVYNGLIAPNFNLPRANDIYYSWGWKIRLE